MHKKTFIATIVVVVMLLSPVWVARANGQPLDYFTTDQGWGDERPRRATGGRVGGQLGAAVGAGVAAAACRGGFLDLLACGLITTTVTSIFGTGIGSQFDDSDIWILGVTGAPLDQPRVPAAADSIRDYLAPYAGDGQPAGDDGSFTIQDFQDQIQVAPDHIMLVAHRTVDEKTRGRVLNAACVFQCSKWGLAATLFTGPVTSFGIGIGCGLACFEAVLRLDDRSHAKGSGGEQAKQRMAAPIKRGAAIKRGR